MRADSQFDGGANVDWLRRIVGKEAKSKPSKKEEELNAVSDEDEQPLNGDADLQKIIQDTIAKLDPDDPIRLNNAILHPENAPEQQNTDESNDSDTQNKKLPPKDATAEIKVSPDMMTATIILHAPQNGGADITADTVYEELAKSNIIFGIEEETISKKVNEHKYEEPFVAARGLYPKDGVDGRIVELVDREKQISIKEDEQGKVDFKDLNLINQVEEGTVLCEIYPPTEPVSGRNIYGAVIYGKPGRMPDIPQGENTVLSDDGAKLIAAKSGNLVYRNERFIISEILEIPENVDASTGNITFSGDVLVKGSVLEGYKVVAGGNVIIYGIAEGVYISAGGNVQLKQGINGMRKGVIEAKGNISCHYLENCTVKAGGSVYADTIIHSNVYSGANIVVSGSRSSIIGGVCSALQTIEVKTIGNRMNTMTTIILGATTEMIEERRKLAIEIEKLEKRLYDISLDVQFIQQHAASRKLTDKHKSILINLQKEYPEITDRLADCKKRAEALEEIIANNTNCRLTCQHIYPPTKINIGAETITVLDERFHCTVYYDGEIKFTYR